MDSVDVFSVRDLRQRSGDLIKEAEHGHLSLITKRGRPAILAVPFDGRLLELGVHRTLALRLFEQRHLTLVQAARLAAMTAEDLCVQQRLARSAGDRPAGVRARAP